MLRVWEKNPGLDVAGLVDNTAVFEFLSGLRNGPNSWVFPFERAQDICETLRGQWAFLMANALEVMARERVPPLPHGLASLTGRARRILLEQGMCWEHELFVILLEQELASRFDLNQSVRHGFARSVQKIAPAQFPKLVEESTPLLWGVIKMANALFPRASSEALGGKDREPDAQKILHAARQFGLAYEQALNYKLFWHGVDCEEANGPELLAILPMAVDSIIAELEALPAKYRKETEAAKEQIRRGIAPSIQIPVVFEMPVGWGERVEQEIEDLKQWILSNSEV